MCVYVVNKIKLIALTVIHNNKPISRIERFYYNFHFDVLVLII